MKILTPKQIAQTDQFTIKNEPISSVDLMERASTKCFEWIITHFPQTKPITVFCGTGNNGGDGLVIARLLENNGFSVNVYILKLGNNPSEEFSINLERLKKYNSTIKTLESPDDFPKITSQTLVIDALFGNGLNRPPEGLALELIQHINHSKTTVISIDLPSGLFANQPVTEPKSVIKAHHTLTFQVPKLALFLPDNKDFVKDWTVLDIGLDENYINQLPTDYYYFTEKSEKSIYKPRHDKWSHKGTFGHALIIGGSYGKMGAALLSSKAALKIGSGLVTAHIPECGYQILQIALPEVMVTTDSDKILSQFNIKVDATSIGIGPGMGTNEETQKGFKTFLENNSKPLVIDADALNCLSLNPELLELLPKNSILTPHPKELERLIGKWKNDYEKIEKVRAFSQKYNVIMVIKGAYTMVVSDDIYFNSSGNVALSTGGSGDVLTGIITGLLAQRYSPKDATLLGIYLHGKTAEYYTEEHAPETFTASLILEYLSEVIKKL